MARLNPRFSGAKALKTNHNAKINPHAERLARLLAREIPRSRQLVLRYLDAPCRSNDYDPQDPRLGIDCMGAAFDHTKAAFPDSS